MLLILSEPGDAHIPFILPTLKARNVEYMWFDPADYPARAQLTFGVGSAGVTRRTLRTADAEVDLSRVTAVWDRRPGTPHAGSAVDDASQRAFVELASRVFAQGFWETLDTRWLPAHPATVRRAENKLVQLDLAARIGFTVPETLITNDPHEFLDFHADQHGRLVTKSLVNIDVKRAAQAHVVVFTHVVQRRDVMNDQSLRHAPAIFQPYVDKHSEIRVTVVGDRVFAAEIASQSSRLTRYDWRHYDDPSVRYSPHTLPIDVERRCLQLVERLGLAFGAIDLILTPSGDYVFLEINANGQWGFIELTDRSTHRRSRRRFLDGRASTGGT